MSVEKQKKKKLIIILDKKKEEDVYRILCYYRYDWNRW